MKKPKIPTFILFHVCLANKNSIPRTRLEGIMSMFKPSEIKLICISFVNKREIGSNRVIKKGYVNNQIFYSIRESSSLTRIVVGFLVLVIIYFRYKPKGIYYRDFISGLCCVFFKYITSVKIIGDIRGIPSEEYVENKIISKNSLKFTLLKLIENFVIRNSSYISCVSNIMKKFLIKNYDVNALKCIVIPNFIAWDKNYITDIKIMRETIRKELGLSDRIVIVYCGGNQKHQCLYETIIFFKKLYEIEKKFFFLVIVEDVYSFLNIANKTDLDVSGYFATSLKFEEIPNYLCAADWGILLRRNSIINKVSCPTKIVEYLGSGLPILLTDNIGDLSEKIKKNKAGIVIPLEDCINDKLILHLKKKILNFPQMRPYNYSLELAREFSKEKIKILYKKLFHFLL